jgi:hypothetical protein
MPGLLIFYQEVLGIQAKMAAHACNPSTQEAEAG